jgi:nucleoside-diphosphate-sugar epimerase
LLALLETLQQITGKHVTPLLYGPRAGDIRHSLADISKIQQVLGYQPRHSLNDGLRALLATK